MINFITSYFHVSVMRHHVIIPNKTLYVYRKSSAFMEFKFPNVVKNSAP